MNATNGNRINKPTKKHYNKSHIKAKKKLVKGFMIIIGSLLLAVLIFFSGSIIYRHFLNSQIPNKEVFSTCTNYFTEIKASPTYGVIIFTDNEVVEKIVLTAPDSIWGIRSIVIPSDSWLAVYFSNNFTFTQVSGFLRLSIFETGAQSYCYIIEQLSLSSGVPVEYVIVKDKSGEISSTISLNAANKMLSNLRKESTLMFDKKLLPLYLLGDGTEVPVVTYSAFVEQFPDFFKIDSIANEQAFVEVYNVTEIPGYAGIISKRWGVLGIDISRVGNASHEKLENVDAVIYVREPDKYVRTLGMIKGSFPKGKVVVRHGRPTSIVTTGDIVVFLLNR